MLAGAPDACQLGIGGNEQGNSRYAERGGKVNEAGIHATDKISACEERCDLRQALPRGNASACDAVREPRTALGLGDISRRQQHRHSRVREMRDQRAPVWLRPEFVGAAGGMNEYSERSRRKFV